MFWPKEKKEMYVKELGECEIETAVEVVVAINGSNWRWRLMEIGIFSLMIGNRWRRPLDQ